jgi:uncharacterized protein (TIGR02271 family)
VNERKRPGGGGSRPPTSAGEAVVRHEEQARIDKRWQGVGYARAGREVEVNTVRADVPRLRDQLAQERVPVGDDDSGEVETLPDGSISIPLFEEELVVTKRTVLRERVIIRKETVTEWETVEAELRREHVTFDADDAHEGS